MNTEFKYHLSHKLLQLELNLITSSSFIEFLDHKIMTEPNYSDLVNVSLAIGKNELISEIHIALENKINPLVYQVILGEILIKNENLELLEKFDLISDFLNAKENSDRNPLIYTLEPFLGEIFSFLQWAWSELNLCQNGTLLGLKELETKLNQFIACLCSFKIDNREEWVRIQSEVFTVIQNTKLGINKRRGLS